MKHDSQINRAFIFFQAMNHLNEEKINDLIHDHKTDPELKRLCRAWKKLTYWQKKTIFARAMFSDMRARAARYMRTFAARWVWARMPK